MIPEHYLIFLEVAPLNFVVIPCFQGVESNVDDCKQFAQMCQEAVQKYDCPVKKALDVMCSVGRFSYELSKFLEEVPYSTAHAYIVPLSLFLVREAPKLNKAI